MLIVIPKAAFSLQSEQYLTPDELIVYSFLYTLKNSDHRIMFSVNDIHQFLKFDVSNTKRNRSMLKKIIISLQSKGYLYSIIDENIDSGYAIMCDVLHTPTDYSGVDSSVLNELLNEKMSNAKLKLYIYADINVYAEGSRLSYSIISDKCRYFEGKKNHSVRKIVDLINEMDGTLIFRFSGEQKENSLEQEINLYVSDRNMTNEKRKLFYEHVNHKQYKKTARRKDAELIKDNPFLGDNVTVKELKEMIKGSNWNKKEYGVYAELTGWDYQIYRIAKDERVAITSVKRIEGAINSLKDDPYCAYDFDKWEDEYLQAMNCSGE